MKIRRASKADIPTIQAIEIACPTAAHWMEADYNQALENVAARRVVLVAESDGQVAGFAIARVIDHEWELENVAVSPERQRKGVGQALVRVLADIAQHSGAKAIYLEVRESNSTARTLYERCGFSQSGLRKDYYSSPDENAVLYRFLCIPEQPENR